MQGVARLDAEQKYLLLMVDRSIMEIGAEGWAPVSTIMLSLIGKIPPELIDLELVGNEGGGRVRLTALGASLIEAMAWLGVNE